MYSLKRRSFSYQKNREVKILILKEILASASYGIFLRVFGTNRIHRVTIFLFPHKNVTPSRQQLARSTTLCLPPSRGPVTSTGALRASLISSKLANKSLHRERRREGAPGEAS